MIPKSKKIKIERPDVKDDKPETYDAGFAEHVNNVSELSTKLVDACEAYSTAVILDSLETVFRGAVTLMGEEEAQMLEDLLVVFHRKLAAMTILRSLLGSSLTYLGGAERKQSLDDLLKDMEKASGGGNRGQKDK